MADGNRSRDVSGHREYSGSTSRPPLPRPNNGDNVRPVPLWERDLCRYAYGFSWETFCKNKRFNVLYRNVLDWDDSGAFKNFEEAKERFRAQYNGEPYEDPVLDPDMYIDEVDHFCIVDPELIVDLDEIAGLARLDLVADMGLGEPVPNLIPKGWGEPVPNLVPTGWGEEPATPTPDAVWGGQGNKKPEAIQGAQPYCTPKNMNNNLFGVGSSSNWHQQEVNPIHTSAGGTRMKLIGGGMKWSNSGGGGNVSNWNNGSGSGGGGSNGRNWNGGGGGRGSNGRNWNGGGGGSGGGRKWNCFGGGSGSGQNGNGGGGKQRNQGDGQHHQRSGGGLQRNQDQTRHLMRRGGGQHQQGQGRRKMEWRPVQHNRAPKDDPAA